MCKYSEEIRRHNQQLKPTHLEVLFNALTLGQQIEVLREIVRQERIRQGIQPAETAQGGAS